LKHAGKRPAGFFLKPLDGNAFHGSKPQKNDFHQLLFRTQDFFFRYGKLAAVDVRYICGDIPVIPISNWA
jgi:hypothetical protein